MSDLTSLAEAILAYCPRHVAKEVCDSLIGMETEVTDDFIAACLAVDETIADYEPLLFWQDVSFLADHMNSPICHVACTAKADKMTRDGWLEEKETRLGTGHVLSQKGREYMGRITR